MHSADRQGPEISQQLLLSIAEQMKLPLLQISRQIELSRLGLEPDLNQIQALAANTLYLIDAYSLGLQLQRQFKFELTPDSVSVASVLYDACQQLDGLARLYNVQLELNIGGKYGPVLAHKRGLQSAIVGIASALIETLPAQGNKNKSVLQLATHRCRYGIVAGVYAAVPGLTSDALRKGRRLYGLSRQPIVDVSHTSGAGIFVADAIFKAMSLRLNVSRHHKLYGLGVVLRPSSQLVLV